MATRAKIKHVGIIGKRWFDRVNGNTYNSVRIFINGAPVKTLGRAYGYGDYYKQRAEEWLIKNGYLKAEKCATGGYPSLHTIARDMGFKYDSQAIDVPRKKDLDEGSWD